jgi:hypothetical protein
LQYDDQELRVSFDPAVSTSLRIAGDEHPRAYQSRQVTSSRRKFRAASISRRFDLHSGAMALTAQGEWGGERPLKLTVANLDRALLRDGLESACA